MKSRPPTSYFFIKVPEKHLNFFGLNIIYSSRNYKTILNINKYLYTILSTRLLLFQLLLRIQNGG